MLKPEYLSKVPASMVELYSQAEMDILTDMARRISTYDYWIPAAEHQAKMLEEMGMVREEIISHLKGLTGKSHKELTALMKEAAEVALQSDDAVYKRNGLNPGPVRASKPIQKVLQSGYKRTQKLFDNLTLTTAKTATKQFENALNRAYMQIGLGGMDYNSAVRSAVKELSKQGVGAVQYPSGKIDNLETAVRRATITGINQTALKMQEARAVEMGCDLVETSAHAGARPSHAEWQGEIFSRSGKSKKYPDFVQSTGYGKGEGLGGWNCSHSFSPYFEGSPRTYTKEQLAKYQDKNYTYNDRKMTEYEALGEQRNIERNIRRWKREQSALRAAGDSTDEASAKIKSWQEREKDFLNQTGLKRQTDRSQIGGYGKSEARRTTAESEKYYKAWTGSISNQGNPKNLAAYYDMKYNNPKEYALLQGYVKAVEKGSISPQVGLGVYTETAAEVKKELVGMTINGIKMESFTPHFIDRIIGQTAEAHENTRKGITVAEIKAGINGKYEVSEVFHKKMPDGSIDTRQKVNCANCNFVISVIDRLFIQANPRR